MPALALPNNNDYQLKEADFLFAYATAQGNLAYHNFKVESEQTTVEETDDRNHLYGSFFISHLCDNLTTYAMQFPLVFILVNDLVSQDLAFGRQNDFQYTQLKGDEIQTILARQSPNFTSRLCGPVFFSCEAQNKYVRNILPRF